MESWKLQKERFGPLWKYVSEDSITNIDWDSERLWIKYANQTRQVVEDPEVTKEFIRDFTLFTANHVGKNFNPVDNILSAETDTLRITCVHESFSTSGLSVSIRKSLPKLRFTIVQALANGYCQKELMHLLLNCVEARMNFVFCGLPGKGKTESAKFFSSFIPAHEKVITIEDLREWHYQKINPGKSCIELKINQEKDYEKALMAALRLNPDWLMLAETRSREVRYLMECWSNGISCMTTLHVNDVRTIPDRILNMSDSRQDSERIVNQIYNDVGIGILLDEISVGKNETRHIIRQVDFYYRKDGENGCALVVDEGKLYKDRLPDFIKKEIETKTRKDAFFNPLVQKALMCGDKK